MHYRGYIPSVGLLLLFGLALVPRASADEVAGTGEHQVVLVGQVTHSQVQDAAIDGAPAGREEAFLQEVYGPEFTLLVPHLPPGNYSVIIGLVENHFKRPGQRVFDITSGTQTLAGRLDILAAAGAKGRVLFLTNTVAFSGKPANAPLAVTFLAQENNAKFNTFEVRDASGQSLVSLRAADFAPAPEDPAALTVPVVAGPELWKDSSQPAAARVDDLVSRLSLYEKVSLLNCDAPGIPRLGIPAYSYRNEALHGLQPHDGYATVFPQAIGMAATWNPSLIHEEADVIATEARATHNNYIAHHHGDSLIHFGLDLYTPNINIFRDPRWGRGQETYGEDPFLTGRIAVGFIQGLQGNDPKYFKAIACAKHYAVHSGPESERHRFNAEPADRDLYETYLPAFEAAVREGRVDSIMAAYSALRGVPDCANPFLLTDILRTRWGFSGFVVSDGGAIFDINNHHKFVPTPEQAAAAAVRAGDDMCSGGLREYFALTKAVKEGLLTEAEINTAVSRSLEARFRLGMFDPPEQVSFAQIPLSENNTPAHEQLALQVARQSIVLLKNKGILPLNLATLRRVAVVGPNADSVRMLLGNYEGRPSRPMTILEGIKTVVGTNAQVLYEEGCPLVLTNKTEVPSAEKWERALALAKTADVVIYVGGINGALESEETRMDFPGFKDGDRTKIELPPVQLKLLQALHATGKPVVLVNCSGSAMAFPWAVKHLPAIIQAWYPGEQGGRAVAEVLFGEVNPSGRLPVTFYHSTDDLPPMNDYSMRNRTYRYFGGKPEFAFGHGLSYTKFAYHQLSLDGSDLSPSGTLNVTFTVKNIGKREGDEVAQVYFRHRHSAVPQPRLALCGFARIHLAPNEAGSVTVTVPAQRLRYWDTDKKQYVVEAGDYDLLVGGASDQLPLRVPFSLAAK